MIRRLGSWLVMAISLHSLAVGLALLFLGRWGLSLGGWEGVSPLFFARQAGVFHVVVAIGYLLEYRRYGSVYLILLAKTAAVIFLAATAWLDGGPWSVSVSAFGDGLMALAALIVHREHRHDDE